jgi:hypothetical protein
MMRSKADYESVLKFLARAVSMDQGKWNSFLIGPDNSASTPELDLISYLKAIPDAHIRRGARFSAWSLLFWFS